MGKISVVERARRAELYVSNGNTVKRACELAGISTPAFYNARKKVREQAKASPADAQVQTQTDQPKTLVGRLLKSNLSSEDKIAILSAAYN